jgi:hypothetical protein
MTGGGKRCAMNARANEFAASLQQPHEVRLRGLEAPVREEGVVDVAGSVEGAPGSASILSLSFRRSATPDLPIPNPARD